MCAGSAVLPKDHSPQLVTSTAERPSWDEADDPLRLAQLQHAPNANEHALAHGVCSSATPTQHLHAEEVVCRPWESVSDTARESRANSDNERRHMPQPIRRPAVTLTLTLTLLTRRPTRSLALYMQKYASTPRSALCMRAKGIHNGLLTGAVCSASPRSLFFRPLSSYCRIAA